MSNSQLASNVPRLLQCWHKERIILLCHLFLLSSESCKTQVIYKRKC